MKKIATALMFFMLALVPAFAQTNYGKFTATTPVVLKAGTPTTRTTESGVQFTATLYSAELPNSDVYMAMDSTYPFAISQQNVEQDAAAFTKALNGTVIKQANISVASGEPAIVTSISAKDTSGREMRFLLVVTYKGNAAYQFAFGSYLDTTTTDMAAVRVFLSTLRIN
jgi:hypothetical protein